MYRIVTLALSTFPTVVAAQGSPGTSAATDRRLCIAPASVESAPNAADAMVAVRDAFSNVLAGPGVKPVALQAKLQSLVREEAKQSGCTYLLMPTFKHVHKTSGTGVLGKAALGAVQSGAYQVGGAASGTAARVAARAAEGAANQAVWNYASTTKTKDEMTLGVRLESSAGQVLLDEKTSRSAQSDGEDVLSPLVQQAAEKIAAIVTKPAR